MKKGETKGFFGFMRGAWRAVIDGFKSLPSASKNWSLAGGIVFLAGCLMGGKVMEAAFIAALATLGVWTLFVEKPNLAKWALKLGFLADLFVTILAFIFIPATVSAGFAVAFFAWFFTCARLGITPIIPRLLAASKARREEGRAQADALALADDDDDEEEPTPALRKGVVPCG